jgi:hypothetical protein
MTKASGSRKPGGGLGSKVVREVGVRIGTSAWEMRPRGVSQIGSSLGNKATETGRTTGQSVEPVKGRPLPAGLSVPLGNEIATKGLGVGGGRNLWGQSGSQKQWGPSAPGAGRIADTRGEWPDTNTKR